MAEEPETNEAFLREVDDELRRSEMAAFWKKWGRWLIGGTVGGLALFGGWLYWQDQQRIASGVESEKVSTALDDAVAGNRDGAVKKLDEVAQSSDTGYSAAARLAKAAVLVDKGDVKAAAAVYASVAADTKLDKPWRDLALMRQTLVEFDTLKPQTVIERLKPMAVRGNPWLGSAGEMVAASYVALGKQSLAAAIYSDIARDEQVPETIRSRAVQMAGVLGTRPAPSSAKVKDK